MKKLLGLILIMVMMLCVAGCGGKSTVTSANVPEDETVEVSDDTVETDEVQEEENNPAPSTPAVTIEHGVEEPEEQIYDLKIGDKVKTDDYEFKLEKVETTYQVDPDTKTSYYHYYTAEDDYVYVHVDLTIKNLQKKNMECDEIYSTTVDYDDGYTYTGFNVADDTDGDLTYANITEIAPLESRGVHALVECPEEVESSKKPIVVYLDFFDGTKYKYKLR